MSVDFKSCSDIDATMRVSMTGKKVELLKKSIQIIESAVSTEMKKQVLS